MNYAHLFPLSLSFFNFIIIIIIIFLSRLFLCGFTRSPLATLKGH